MQDSIFVLYNLLVFSAYLLGTLPALETSDLLTPLMVVVRNVRNSGWFQNFCWPNGMRCCFVVVVVVAMFVCVPCSGSFYKIE